jgi:hypothetical protein
MVLPRRSVATACSRYTVFQNTLAADDEIQSSSAQPLIINGVRSQRAASETRADRLSSELNRLETLLAM